MTTEATARTSTEVRTGDSVQAVLTETERVCVDDICFDNIDTPTALAVVRSFLHEPQPRTPRQVSFANVHSISIARYDHELRYALHRADLVLPDGSGLSLAGRLNGLPVRENMNGTDFIPRVLDLLAHQKMSVFLLGGHPDVVSACREILTQRYPGLRIAGTHHGQFAGIDDQAIQEFELPFHSLPGQTRAGTRGIAWLREPVAQDLDGGGVALRDEWFTMKWC